MIKSGEVAVASDDVTDDVTDLDITDLDFENDDRRGFQLSKFNPMHVPKSFIPEEVIPDNGNNNIDVLIIGDSIVKHVNPAKVHPGAVVECMLGARYDHIFSRLFQLSLSHNIKKAIIHVGTNYIPSLKSHQLADELNEFLVAVNSLHTDCELISSAVLPKYSDAYLPGIKLLNGRVERCCEENGIGFINNANFGLARKGNGNKVFICKDSVHPSYKGVAALERNMSDYLLMSSI